MIWKRLRSLERWLVSCWCGCSQILFVAEHALLMMYVVCVLNLNVFQIGMLGYWFLIVFYCSCHSLMTRAVYRMCLGLLGSDGLLVAIMMFVLLCCVLCAAFGLSQRRVGVGYALRVSPVVTRLTVYRRPQVMRTGRNWATNEQNYIWQTGSLSDACSGK